MMKIACVFHTFIQIFSYFVRDKWLIVWCEAVWLEQWSCLIIFCVKFAWRWIGGCREIEDFSVKKTFLKWISRLWEGKWIRRIPKSCKIILRRIGSSKCISSAMVWPKFYSEERKVDERKFKIAISHENPFP